MTEWGACEGGFKDDLGGRSAEVEDGVRGALGFAYGFLGRGLDCFEKVVGCDPGKDTFVFPGHECVLHQGLSSVVRRFAVSCLGWVWVCFVG